MSIPGIVDSSSRRLQQVPLLPSLNGFPLCDLLETRYHLPTQLLVDVDAAVLGEHRFGAGKGYQRLLFLTVNAVVGRHWWWMDSWNLWDAIMLVMSAIYWLPPMVHVVAVASMGVSIRWSQSMRCKGLCSVRFVVEWRQV